MTPTPDHTIGARAMLAVLNGEDVWDKLPPHQQAYYCSAFSAGEAAMPDHTAELLEALIYARRFLSIGDQDTPYLDAIIAKARARKGTRS